MLLYCVTWNKACHLVWSCCFSTDGLVLLVCTPHLPKALYSTLPLPPTKALPLSPDNCLQTHTTISSYPCQSFPAPLFPKCNCFYLPHPPRSYTPNPPPSYPSQALGGCLPSYPLCSVLNKVRRLQSHSIFQPHFLCIQAPSTHCFCVSCLGVWRGKEEKPVHPS